ncbi:MAG: HAMP domain-containing histidine kinase, partial [Erysipelotrichia bacterium]|nr:HAMP domain-containing histidine kinase [Erysipelotrichia bacterium]
IYTYALPFKEQVGMLLIYSYPLINYAQPFQYVVLLVAFSIYLLIMLYCIQAKIITIKKIQEDISILASGDLAHEIQVADNDELGDLANHLNQMRVSFLENIESEKEARNANRDLISAMSHDLRTPLTTLNGYLEIVQLEKGDKKKREEYIKRCLNKVEEISDLSNKMFEYSLVFSNDDNVEMQYVNGKDIKQVLEDHIQYLKVLGFHVQSEYINCESMVYVNMMMFKRIFNNLFSNIQKYADKSEDVIVLCTHKKDQWKFVLANAKNKQVGQVESNRIGLKSVRKIVALHHGECYINDSDDQFRVIITIPMEE